MTAVPSNAIEIAPIFSATPEIAELIAELNDELSVLYNAHQRHGLALDAIFQPHIRFFIARKNGVAMGCGGVALFDDFAEVKRMYVRDAARGQGIADAIMQRLEAETGKAGLTLLRLESGIHSHAAIRFYRRRGFSVCPAFAPYTAMPETSVVTSYFMEKLL